MTDWQEYEVRRSEWHRRLRERDVALETAKDEFDAMVASTGEAFWDARARHKEAWARVHASVKMETMAYDRMREVLA